MRHSMTLLMLLMAIHLAGPAASQSTAAPPIPSAQLRRQPLPEAEHAAPGLGHWVGRLREMMGLSRGSLELARRAASEDEEGEEDFNWLMGVAGFKLKSIESTVGLVPSLSLEFGQARELSEADREYMELALERHATRYRGPLAAVQRMIVSGIMEANEIQGFGMEKVVVTLFPLPYVKFTLAPVDAPLGQDASRLMRAIDRLNQRLQNAPPAMAEQPQAAPRPSSPSTGIPG
jgi:hypothetical protein